MAHSKIFASASQGSSRRTQIADAVNHAGGIAYRLQDNAALAQLALTGVVNDTYYTSAQTQLEEVQDLAQKVDTRFLAQLAVYARQNGYMKDLPAYLCAVLAQRDVALLAKVFDRVIDNGKMLRNFVQIIRSSQAGRRSLGSRPKALVARWLNNASDYAMLAASVGTEPSLADVIKLSHVKAKSAERDAFFKFLLGRDVEAQQLPELVRQLHAFRKGDSLDLPKVPFELLTSLPLSSADWKTIARNASWQQTRMNLNTFERHGVLEDRELLNLLAERLRDPELIARAKVFPYQLLAAHLNVSESMPYAIRYAIEQALEVASRNVPMFEESVAVLVDTSGSMSNPVTGVRQGSTSAMRYIDVAALMASTVLRCNPEALIVPFDTVVHKAQLNPMDTITTNASKLAKYGGGGTNCGAALEHLNAIQATAGLVMYVSDNESWRDPAYGGRTAVSAQWSRYKARVPHAKLVCIDISPNTTSQAQTRKDCLNIGGFSDQVFDVIAKFTRGETHGEHLVRIIESVEV